MALSKEFLKEAHTAADREKDAAAIFDAQKVALDNVAKPVIEVLQRLKRLAPHSDGNRFVYERTYNAAGGVPTLNIQGAYAAPGQERDDGENKKTLLISIQETGGSYRFSATDLAGKSGQDAAAWQRFDTAGLLADKFLGGWVGRSMPGAAAKLDEQEKNRLAWQARHRMNRYLDSLR